MEHSLETRLADVFNREYQAHPDGAAWQDVMRAVAYEISCVLHPTMGVDQLAWLEAANMSGLFPQHFNRELDAKIGR